MTKEDFIPKWLRKRVPKLFDFTAHLVTMSWFDLEGRVVEDIAEAGKLHRPGAAHEQSLKVVCGRCNNTWMSEIVEDAKPYILELIEDR